MAKKHVVPASFGANIERMKAGKPLLKGPAAAVKVPKPKLASGKRGK